MNTFSRLFMTFVLLHSGTALAETTFTYQGRLGSAGQPAEGNHDFVFRLFDMDTGGTQVGSDLPVDSVAVSSGIFTVPLDFGDAPFNSSPRWLEIDVRESGSGMYTTLTPRQRVGASPFAIETLFVAPGAVDTAALQDNAVTQAKLADNSVGTFQIQNNSVSSSDIRDGGVSAVDLAPNAVASANVVNGSLLPEDFAGAVLTSKTQIQTMTDTQSVGVSMNGTMTASCNGANDIPLAMACQVLSSSHAFEMRSMDPSNWDNTTAPASVRCVMRNSGSLSVTAQAVIFCLEAP